MSGEVLDDYGNPLNVGSTPDVTVAAPFPGLDTDPNTNPNTSTDVNSPVKSGDVFTNQTSTPIDFSGIQKLISDNRGLLTAGGAALGLMGGNSAKYGTTGYQGTIPQLSATRQMLTAPPKTNPDGTPRRPGQGGINYGGDVTYTRTPGQDPWMRLSGDNNSGKGIDELAKPAAPVAPPANLGSKGYQAFIAAGKTPQEYLSAINQWIIDNPNASQADIAAAMKKFDVTQEDLQAALTSSGFSDATKYYMTHGNGGIKELNTNILDWVAKNPNATKQQIADAIKASGVDTRDIGRALGTEDQLSKAKEYALTHGMSLDYFNDIINNYMGTKPEAADAKKFKEQYGITDTDVAEAAKYAAPTAGAEPEEPSVSDVQQWLTSHQGASDEEIARAMKTFNVDDDLMAAATGLTPEEVAARRAKVGFAMGGMAKGRYLQGETDGMADELPAQIGDHQPAALSHGEFVVPADVVSHLGNGNSDAGAKKLYQMMDKIRMARTGTKKQGKEINPDKFMPGGLASSKYAAGGTVKHFLTGGTTGVGSAANAGVTGVESNLSNWAGDYVTNMLGQGQALANMPYQAYTGPLTAGPSALQTKVSQGLQGVNFPGILGKSFTSPTGGQMPMGNQMDPGAGYRGAAPKTEEDWNNFQGLAQFVPGTDMAKAKADFMSGSAGKNVGGPEMGAYTAPADMPQVMPREGGYGGQQPGGIAQSYMNPYLQSVLNPQLDELQRRSQINLQPDLAKLTQAGGFGGSRQALMQGEAGRNLLQEQNKTVGQGYANAYDKAMQQFNTEQGQAKDLVGLMSGVGATDRGIESEGIAADKAQFEEARNNPYKMVQFQQSLLSGLPLAAQNYNLAQPSTLQNIAGGATTVADLIDILSGKTPAKKAP